MPASDEATSFGELLRDHRGAAGLTQEESAFLAAWHAGQSASLDEAVTRALE
jgi:hypothetical protein